MTVLNYVEQVIKRHNSIIRRIQRQTADEDMVAPSI